MKTVLTLWAIVVLFGLGMISGEAALVLMAVPCGLACIGALVFAERARVERERKAKRARVAEHNRGLGVGLN